MSSSLGCSCSWTVRSVRADHSVHAASPTPSLQGLPLCVKILAGKW